MPIYTIKTGASASSSQENNGRKLVRTSNGDLHCIYQRPVSSYNHICYAKSVDGGENWTETILSSGNYHQYNPSIAVDSQDHLHVVWYGTHSLSTTYRQIRYRKFTDSWQTIVNLTSGNYHQGRPSIAIDSNDYVHVAWYGTHSLSATYGQIRYVKYTDSWQTIENLTSGNYNQRGPSIAIDSLDYVHIVWYGYCSLDPTHYAIRYIKNTGSWQAVEFLSGAGYHHYYPCIAIESNNHIHIVWEGNDAGTGGNSVIKHIEYTDSWQAVETVAAVTNWGLQESSIAIESNDHFHVVWSGYITGETVWFQIRYRKFTDSWQAQAPLTNGASDKMWPNLIWAFYPVIDGLRTNRPKTGFAFIFVDDTTVKIYISADLTWDTTVPPPPVVLPSIPADPQALTGYLCFIKQYILNKVKGWAPLKLPDGTLWD